MRATIVEAYRRLGLPLTPTFASHLAGLREHGRGSGGTGHDLGRFGTSTEAVRARFADVRAAFEFGASEPVRPRDFVRITPTTARDAA
jgi:hypothetical protein